MKATADISPKPAATVFERISTTESHEESGRTKRKRVPRKQQADELNGCLCGDVVEPDIEGALKCRQAGCETEWVAIVSLPSLHSLIYMPSIILDALTLTKPHETGFVQRVRCQAEAEVGSGCGDDVILPYLEWCLIT